MNISPEIKYQIPNTQSLFWIGSLISGILLGLSAPGFGTNWVGILAFFPLLAVLDQLHKNRLFSPQKRAGLFLQSAGFPEVLLLRSVDIGLLAVSMFSATFPGLRHC